MAKRATPRPFDATVKSVIDLDPVALARLAGWNASRLTVLNSDLATKLAADRLFRLEDQNRILDFEAQAQPDPSLPKRLLAYTAVGELKYDLPVAGIALLLCKEADCPAMSGLYQTDTVRFAFQVIRLWELSPDVFFTPKPTLLPLAPLSGVSEAELPSLIQRMTRAISAAFEPSIQRRLWANAHVLMGLRFKTDLTDTLLDGVFQMLDLSTSTTYQQILARGTAKGIAIGEIKEARRLLVLVGSKRFGEPDARTRRAIGRIDAPQRLEALATRIFEVESWRELLAG